LTGRHPFRYGIQGANKGHIKTGEITLAELLKELGYTSGHFGKWHLGTLTPEYSGKGPGRKPKENYSPPDRNGFDEWFSTEFAVATWDPYARENSHVAKRLGYDTRALYWHNGSNVTTPLEGDDSRIIMDRAIPFIRDAAKADRPFFTVIWFHAPHSPVVGGPAYRALYQDYPENKQHYYACITALDEQVGRLRKTLREVGVADNTMLWFCSDNGPAGQGGGTQQRSGGRQQGSAGPFRGRKGSLFEGGVRVPGILEWPAQIDSGTQTDLPLVTSDYLPTIAGVLGVELLGTRPYDGIDVLPLIQTERTNRPQPIGFRSPGQLAWNDNRFKLISPDKGESWMLFDLIEDCSETINVASKLPATLARMKAQLNAWMAECSRSDRGEDYGE